MEISEQEFQAATLRGEEVRRRGYAVRADYDSRQNRLVVDLNTGVTIMVPVHLIEELADATADSLGEIEISPAGTALHWPRLNALHRELCQPAHGIHRRIAGRELGAAGQAADVVSGLGNSSGADASG